MSRLKIVADRNIAEVATAFAGLGEVVALPAAELTRQTVKDADLLLTRSTVKVGPALLEGSRVRFVATATIGIDHLDIPWLDAQGITWAAAPGSNADSVVQWFAAALLRMCAAHERDPASLRIGVVGVGQVGGRIARLAEALGGPPPLLCDPPRARRENSSDFVPLDELLGAAELVTLHVPLDRHGEDKTVRLFDPRGLRPGTLLFNASRGEVLDTTALINAQDIALALDVFENEPSPNPLLVARATVATPHIAGHSLDGKLAGTRMVYEAACRFLCHPATWRPSPPPPPALQMKSDGRSDAELLLAGLRFHYRVESDDEALRAIVARPEPERGAAFSAYRNAYPIRRELDPAVTTLSPSRLGVEQMLVSLRKSA